ncbi:MULTISPECIES: carbohydrate ABC transporter permease [Virgibacillus]|uniref:L-arabinose transport system permease protein AraQ n=2 Tax=Virgibacillus TaxID=84406 RepID=A0A024Q7B6_9BACI|nr:MULTISPECIES: carbohydrate ABC transporter permease [Virgibacillus]EQB38080.1 sugar ABC transporter permease [Virgibacillus sp. CM-4]MYL40797.1 ABC transporter permease subunit [Virgibacillus massiliensis]GGJ51901.1 sugar ABC transporter permease [Virgibacillus kapii]CDQ38408.1 L-arabinose transport system permease protein AraQ [Virgibacillus massiliensis]
MELKNRFERSIVNTLLFMGGLLVSLPFVWMILSSFKNEREVLSIPPTLFPNEPTFEHYINLFQNLNFDIYLVNTFIIVFFSMVGLLLNTMAGYGFGKFQFRGKEIWFATVLLTMMIPGQVTMIPTYLILNEAGLTNSMAGIVLPGLIAAFNIFLIRQFMVTIPDDLIEAARLDGAGEFYIFFKLIIPLAKPILAVQIILTFIGAWNSFLWPLIIANDESLYTLSVGLALLQDQNVTNYGLQMAGSTFMVVPVLIIFIIFQKHIVEGFNVSGIK